MPAWQLWAVNYTRAEYTAKMSRVRNESVMPINYVIFTPFSWAFVSAGYQVLLYVGRDFSEEKQWAGCSEASETARHFVGWGWGETKVVHEALQGVVSCRRYVYLSIHIFVLSVTIISLRVLYVSFTIQLFVIMSIWIINRTGRTKGKKGCRPVRFWGWWDRGRW